MAKDPFDTKKTKKESKVEKEICEFAEYYGWFQTKFVAPAFNGMPDRIFFREGEVILAEIKQLGKRPDRLQMVRARQLKAAGITVHWFDSLEEAKDVFRR